MHTHCIMYSFNEGSEMNEKNATLFSYLVIYYFIILFILSGDAGKK